MTLHVINMTFHVINIKRVKGFSDDHADIAMVLSIMVALSKIDRLPSVLLL